MYIRKRLVAAAAFIGVAALSTGALAASRDDNIELQRKLYARLSQLLSVDASALQQSGTFLVLAPSGGFLLDPSFDLSQNGQRAVLTNALTDIRIRESWIESVRPGAMSSIYRAVLRDHQTPIYSLTADEELLFKQLDSALYQGTGTRRKPSDLLQGARNAEDNLTAATTLVEQYQKANPGQAIPQSLLLTLKRAKQVFEQDAERPHRQGVPR